MSEQKEASGQSGGSGAETEKKDSVSYDSYSKLLGEKKKLQTEAENMRGKLAEIEQAKLEAEGKVKEALENQKKLTEQYKNKNLEIVKTVSNKAVRSQFFREAEKLGCVDADIAMKAVTFEDLEITDDFEFDNQKLVGKIQELTKSKPYLFKKDFKLPEDVVPNSQNNKSGSLDDLSIEQLSKMFKELKN
jgi:multidrug efflux pump subunit AcrA (membrane-fusion protein)